jgi:hypothetical protein
VKLNGESKMTQATIKNVDHELIGKRVSVLPGKTPPQDDASFIGKEAIIVSAAVITTIHDEAFLDFCLLFDDGQKLHSGRERFKMIG